MQLSDVFDDVPWEEVIRYLPNVKIIICHEICSHAILECIAKFCPKLETLDIQHSYNIASNGLRFLYQKRKGQKLPCPLLKEIFLKFTSANAKSVKNLVKTFPLLERIDYTKLPFVLHSLYKNDFTSLETVPKYIFTHLDLLKCHYIANTVYYDEILKACVKLCPNLRSLYCVVSLEEHLNLCSTLTKLENLNIKCSKDTGMEINDFLKEKGEKLKCLNLCNFAVSLFVLGHHCRNVRQLTLNEVNIQYNPEDSMPILCNIKEFTIENVDLSKSSNCKAICNILTSSLNLEKLYMKKCKSFASEIKNKVLQCCEQSALKFIDFGGSSVDTEFFKVVLLTCSTLKSLNIEGCNVANDREDLNNTANIVPNRPKITFTDNLRSTDDHDELTNDYDEYLAVDRYYKNFVTKFTKELFGE